VTDVREAVLIKTGNKLDASQARQAFGAIFRRAPGLSARTHEVE
jgi:hypothetical protein